MNVSLKFLSVGFGQDAPIGLAGESSNQLKVKFLKSAIDIIGCLGIS